MKMQFVNDFIKGDCISLQLQYVVFTQNLIPFGV